MNVDHYFTIGTDHQAQGRPCEDYALSGALPGGAVFGVVSDGCSGANAHTDLGARALAWAFRQSARHAFLRSPDALFDEAFPGELLAAFASHCFTDAPKDTLATVVGFLATPDAAAVYVQGDGALILRLADGSSRFVQFSWANNMPYYLGYHLRAGLVDQYEREMAADGTSPPFTVATTCAAGSGDHAADQPAPTVDAFTLEQVKGGHVLRFNPRAQGVVSLAVMTDGVEQVGAVPALQVAQAFTAFKNSEGEFLKRRLLKALKEYKKAEAVPRDDVGIAAVWFGALPAAPAAPADKAGE